MDNLLTRIYALLVCFVAVVCITITSGMAIYETVKIVNPELTLSPYQYQHLQSNEGYRRAHYPGMRIAGPFGQDRSTDALPERTDEELQQQRDNELRILIANERKMATASLIRLAIVLLVTVPLFLVHWRIAQRNTASG